MGSKRIDARGGMTMRGSDTSGGASRPHRVSKNKAAALTRHNAVQISDEATSGQARKAARFWCEAVLETRSKTSSLPQSHQNTEPKAH